MQTEYFRYYVPSFGYTPVEKTPEEATNYLNELMAEYPEDRKNAVLVNIWLTQEEFDNLPEFNGF